MDKDVMSDMSCSILTARELYSLYVGCGRDVAWKGCRCVAAVLGHQGLGGAGGVCWLCGLAGREESCRAGRDSVDIDDA